jgi:hypothetical protein
MNNKKLLLIICIDILFSIVLYLKPFTTYNNSIYERNSFGSPVITSISILVLINGFTFIIILLYIYYEFC